jgi:hypothetical protein
MTGGVAHCSMPEWKHAASRTPRHHSGPEPSQKTAAARRLRVFHPYLLPRARPPYAQRHPGRRAASLAARCRNENTRLAEHPAITPGCRGQKRRAARRLRVFHPYPCNGRGRPTQNVTRATLPPASNVTRATHKRNHPTRNVTQAVGRRRSLRDAGMKTRGSPSTPPSLRVDRGHKSPGCTKTPLLHPLLANGRDRPTPTKDRLGCLHVPFPGHRPNRLGTHPVPPDDETSNTASRIPARHASAG